MVPSSTYERSIGAAGAVPRLDRAGRPWARALRWTGLCAASLLAVFLAGFVGFVSRLDRAERDPGAISDGIVALTGGNGRIGDAIDLLSKGFAARLLITGVNERTSLEEIARLNPHQKQLVECCVDLDYRARNTVGNAVETSRWAHQNGFRSLIVVTSNYHMPRTLSELDRALPEARKLPYAVVTTAVDADQWWRNPGTARLLFAEYAKYVAVLLRNHTFGGEPVARDGREPVAATPVRPGHPEGMRLAKATGPR